MGSVIVAIDLLGVTLVSIVLDFLEPSGHLGLQLLTKDFVLGLLLELIVKLVAVQHLSLIHI